MYRTHTVHSAVWHVLFPQLLALHRRMFWPLFVPVRQQTMSVSMLTRGMLVTRVHAAEALTSLTAHIFTPNVPAPRRRWWRCGSGWRGC